MQEPGGIRQGKGHGGVLFMGLLPVAYSGAPAQGWYHSELGLPSLNCQSRTCSTDLSTGCTGHPMGVFSQSRFIFPDFVGLTKKNKTNKNTRNKQPQKKDQDSHHNPLQRVPLFAFFLGRCLPGPLQRLCCKGFLK